MYFELVITPEYLEDNENFLLITREEKLYLANYFDFCQTGNDFKDYELDNHDIMSIYRKEGYDLIKVWERKEPKSKEEIQELKFDIDSEIDSPTFYENTILIKMNEIIETINILKEQGE